MLEKVNTALNIKSAYQGIRFILITAISLLVTRRKDVGYREAEAVLWPLGGMLPGRGRRCYILSRSWLLWQTEAWAIVDGLRVKKEAFGDVSRCARFRFP